MMKSEYDIFTCLFSRCHSNRPLVVIVNGWWIELIPNMENEYVPLINKHIKLMLCVLFCLNRTLIAFGIIVLFFSSWNVFPCYYLLRSNKIQRKAWISIPISIQLIVPVLSISIPCLQILTYFVIYQKSFGSRIVVHLIFSICNKRLGTFSAVDLMNEKWKFQESFYTKIEWKIHLWEYLWKRRI